MQREKLLIFVNTVKLLHLQIATSLQLPVMQLPSLQLPATNLTIESNIE